MLHLRNPVFHKKNADQKVSRLVIKLYRELILMKSRQLDSNLYFETSSQQI